MSEKTNDLYFDGISNSTDRGLVRWNTPPETVIRTGLSRRPVPCPAEQDNFSIFDPALSRPVREQVRTPGQDRAKLLVL